MALGGCSGAPAEPVETPAVAETTAPAATEPPPTVDATPVTPDDAAPGPTESTTAPTAETTTTLTPIEQPEPQGGPWQELDLTLRSGADVIQQDDLPQTFKDFLVSRIGVEDESGCTVEEVTLHGIHRDGYAYGVEDSDCGGMQTVWGIADNQWNYIVAFLDAPPCEDVAYNNIPEGAPGLRCTDDDGSARDY